MRTIVKDNEGKRVNKYINESIIQGNYGYGWEDLCCYYKGALKEYNMNERGFPHRVIKRRSLNPLWVELNN